MALDALWAVLIPEVSRVSEVQAPIHAGLRDTPAVLPEVSEVSGKVYRGMGAALIVGTDTPDTPPENVRYQAQPAWALGCTLDTPDTCKIINTEAHAANELLYGDLLTGWNVTIPPGTSAATLSKFRAASLALDAAQAVAGGTLALPGTNPAPTTTTAMNPRERGTHTVRLARFTDKGVSHDDAQLLADKLLIRDRDSDDRRLCLECTHLTGYGHTSWRCSNWQRAGVAIRARDNQLPADLVLQLQHCYGLTHAFNPNTKVSQ